MNAISLLPSLLTSPVATSPTPEVPTSMTVALPKKFPPASEPVPNNTFKLVVLPPLNDVAIKSRLPSPETSSRVNSSTLERPKDCALLNTKVPSPLPRKNENTLLLKNSRMITSVLPSPLISPIWAS